jgi:hypothetical protein
MTEVGKIWDQMPFHDPGIHQRQVRVLVVSVLARKAKQAGFDRRAGVTIIQPGAVYEGARAQVLYDGFEMRRLSIPPISRT